MTWSGHLANSFPPDGEPSSSDGSRAGDVLYGEHTAKALRNFAVRGPRLRDHAALVRAIVLVKIAAARVNARLGEIETPIAAAIESAGREVGEGRHGDQFVLPVLQGGGGTSTHMNVNEVLAHRATQHLREQGIERDVHPNDHVNRGQSTNDVMPTAIALAVHDVGRKAVKQLAGLANALRTKAEEYPHLEHLGRTCLQDAVALPVSALHRSHAYGIEQAIDVLRCTQDALLEVPLGATAVGTGLGAHHDFADLAITEIADLAGLPVRRSEDPYFALASLEPLVAVSEAIDRCARSIARVASDLRLLASGPVGGIGELHLPEVQAGSSIMPGKVNPVMPELMIQIAFQCAGEATSARMAANAGELEVSAMAPVVTIGLLAGLERLGSGARLFIYRCIDGLRWNEAAVRANLDGSLGPAVVAATSDGYEAVAQRSRTARQNAAGNVEDPV